MHYIKSCLRRMIGAGISLCLAAFAAPASLAATAYVEAVEAEVREFRTGSFDLPAESPWAVKSEVSLSDDVASKEFAEFDAFFKKKAPGTYIRYSQLPDSAKLLIFQDYVKTGDFKKTKARVLETVRNR